MTPQLGNRPGVAIGLALVIGASVGWTSPIAGASFAVVIALGVAIDRLVLPRIDRRDRGARAEESMGGRLEQLVPAGWLALHDIDTGRGNIGHLLIGPAGVYAIETKSHRGKLHADRLDPRWLRQAYAQAHYVKRITGRPMTPLLVLPNAYLEPAICHRRGVTVLPARLLHRGLDRRPPCVSRAAAYDLYHHLHAVLSS